MTFPKIKYNNNVPLLRQFGSSNKITYDNLLKFINDNKEYILNPHNDDSINNSNNNFLDNNFAGNANLRNILDIGETEKINYLPLNVDKILHLNNSSLLRTGVIESIKDTQINVSVISCILTCLSSNFLSKSPAEQTTYISYVFNKINGYFTNNFEQEYKNFGWKKMEVSKDLQNIISHKFLKICADFFHVNLFILNCNDDIISYIGNTFIPYKKNIFLFDLGDHSYQPLFFNDSKYLQYNSYYIQNIISNSDFINVINMDNKYNSPIKFEISIESLEKYLSEKEIKLTFKDKMLLKKMNYNKNDKTDIEKNDTDINDYEEINDNNVDSIEIENISDIDSINDNSVNSDTESDESENDETDDIITKSPTSISSVKNKEKYNKKLLDSKKIDELKNIATQLNITHKINVNGKEKLKTKKQLVDDILNDQ